MASSRARPVIISSEQQHHPHHSKRLATSLIARLQGLHQSHQLRPSCHLQALGGQAVATLPTLGGPRRDLNFCGRLALAALEYEELQGQFCQRLYETSLPSVRRGCMPKGS